MSKSDGFEALRMVFVICKPLARLAVAAEVQPTVAPLLAVTVHTSRSYQPSLNVPEAAIPDSIVDVPLAPKIVTV